MLRDVLRRQRTRRYAKAFQVVEFTIQDDHLHRFTRWRSPVIDVHGDAALWPQAPPKTWLLERGWWTRTRQGLLDPNEVRRRGP